MKKRNFLFVLLSFYCFIAVGIVGYNIVTTVSEIKDWYFLTDIQKRHKIFGNLYDFFTFIDKNTPENAKILIVSSDVRTFFLSRYYLYPKKIIVLSSPKDISDLKIAYEYIASYGMPLSLNEYSLILTCGAKDGKGFLYKKR